MAFISALVKDTVKMRGSLMTEKHQKAAKVQIRLLKKFVDNCRLTQFGKHYGFTNLLKYKGDEFLKAFKEAVPVFDYNKIHNEWWIKAEEGKANIAWAGKVKFFALTSGTSEAASKRVPITSNLIRTIRKTSIRQVYSLSKLDLDKSFYEKEIMLLGGATTLTDKGKFQEGDMSGILARKLPVWVYKYYKPGRDIAGIKDWNIKLDLIVEQAKDWDIGIITGVPAWYQLLFERMLAYYKVDNIHEIWPNLKIFVHGGVAFEPYKKTFAKYLGKELIYLETYLASEGFLAYQAIGQKGMRLVLDNGIFFEFVPYNSDNFNDDGTIKPNPTVLSIDEINEEERYAPLITTCAGAWRYLIGDVIKIVNKKTFEVAIVGRTKMFLSLCGEHLSVDNMNKAITACGEELGISFNEYAVAGTQNQHKFGHFWYLGADDVNFDAETIKLSLDKNLKSLNDDYATERKNALSSMEVQVLPTKVFYEWMERIGKFGSQNKFPRVLKGKQLEDWKQFLKEIEHRI